MSHSVHPNMNHQFTSILSLPANTKGRDFVVGDLRGAFYLLEQAMVSVFFNPDTDRLFSVGNALGKEPDSANCIDFFSKPYVHAVLGQNEANIINLYNLIGTDTPNYLIRGEHLYKKGLNWWIDISAELKLAIISTLKKLPLVIETKTLSGLNVGIIHGEVPMGMDWDTFKTLIAAQNHQAMTGVLEGSRRINSNDSNPVVGIDRIFVGHSTVQPEYEEGLPIYGNIIMTDTGAALNLNQQSAGLSIIDMDSLNSIMVETEKFSKQRKAGDFEKLDIPDVLKILHEPDELI